MASFPLSFRASLTALPLAILLAGAPATSSAADVTPTDARIGAYLSLQKALERDDLDAASRHAAELLSLSEATFGATSRELVNPLANAGTVAWRRGEFARAEALYLRAIGLIDGQQGGADPLLVRPLQGLGEVLLATNRATEAIGPLKRAVDLSRNLDGLYNIGQIDIVDALIEAYVAAGILSEAEREHQFAFRVAETTFGKRDPRLLDPLERYARWFEHVGRYTTARGIHARALQLVEQLPPENGQLGIPALRGLSRTWFYEALYGPELEPEQGAQLSENPGMIGVNASSSRMSADGERALRMALDLLTGREPADLRIRGEIQTQLGDWYLVSGNATRMAKQYRDAWESLGGAGADARALLAAPRLLFYKPPPISTRRLQPENPTDYVERRVEFSLKVGTDGRVVEAEIGATDAPEVVQRSALAAVKRARYAPRVVDGVVTETAGVALIETLYVKVAPTAPSE